MNWYHKKRLRRRRSHGKRLHRYHVSRGGIRL